MAPKPPRPVLPASAFAQPEPANIRKRPLKFIDGHVHIWSREMQKSLNWQNGLSSDDPRKEEHSITRWAKATSPSTFATCAGFIHVQVRCKSINLCRFDS